MTPTDQQRVKDLFSEAVELASSERSTFLEQVRSESTVLCAQVEAMLRDYESAEENGFLAKPAAAADDATLNDASPEQTMSFVSGAGSLGQKVDPTHPIPCLADDYELLDELGKGGMGVVYRAFQRSLRRHVAVKIIPTRLINSPEESARFYLEAEAAARLDHPGIVPVQDVGERNGVHFYTMALVTGGSLNDYVGREGEQDKPRLPVRRVAEIIEAVSHAVQYAHDHAVIHRDIKPANILLDEHGRPRLTDFGLAKLTNTDDHLTMTGQVMGTPSYMAPEQAEGDSHAVTNRTDVYSLGATLYALLSGRAPFSGETLFNTLNMVKHSLPTALPANVPLDLRTICEKCLAKLPADRYESAGKLADDLRRYLDGFPIAARPLGPVQRLERWSRRNPLVAALWVFVALGAVAAAAFGVEARRQERAARTNLVQSQANLQRVLGALNTLVSINEDVLRDEPGMLQARKTVLEAGRRGYEQLLQSGQITPLKTASTIFELASVQVELGDMEAAKANFDRALQLQNELLRAANDAHESSAVQDLLAQIGQTHREFAELGHLIWQDGVERNSKEAIEEGLDLWIRHAEQSVEARRQVSEAKPNDAELRRKFAHGLMNLAIGKICESASKHDPKPLESADELLQQAQDIRRSIVDAHDSPAMVQRDLGQGVASMADCAVQKAEFAGDEEHSRKLFEEALKLRIEAAEIFDRLPEAFEPRNTLQLQANSHQLCAESYFDLQRFPEAVASYQQGLIVRQQLLLRDPNDSRFRLGVAETLYNLCQMLLELDSGDYDTYFYDCQQTLIDGVVANPENLAPINRLVQYTINFAHMQIEAKVSPKNVGPKFDYAKPIDRALELLEELPSSVRKQSTIEQAITDLTAERDRIKPTTSDAI